MSAKILPKAETKKLEIGEKLWHVRNFDGKEVKKNDLQWFCNDEYSVFEIMRFRYCQKYNLDDLQMDIFFRFLKKDRWLQVDVSKVTKPITLHYLSFKPVKYTYE